MTFSRRWVWVLIPLLGVLAIEALQHRISEPVVPAPVHLFLVSLFLVGGAVLIAAAAFRRFDRMTADLQARTGALGAQSQAMAALERVTLVVAALRELDRILETVTEQARLLLNGDVALLCLAGDDGRLSPRARRGPPQAFHPGLDACPHPDGQSGVCPLLAASGDPTSGGPTSGDPSTAPQCRFVDPAYLGSAVAVPLLVGDRVLGTLAVSADRARPFGAVELATLDSLARVAAVAIDNERLNRRVRDLGMVEERNRIARELHDGLAQVLAYVGTKTEAASSLLEAGRPAEARAQLVDLADVARSTYVDVREAILGLSAPLEPGRGVVPAIRDYASSYAEAAKLATQVVASADAEAIRLAPAAEAQGLRILQEALTNVRKHARARRVTIQASRDGDALLLEVRDDGRGFVPDATRGDWPRFGLQTMRERASSVGGEVEVSSRSGTGTQVRIRLPISEEPP